MKITKRLVETLNNATGKDLFIRDNELKGFGLRITANGAKSFIVEARIKGGSPRRVTLGKYPLLSVEKAREQAHQLLASLKQGIDPAEQEREEAQRAQAAKAHQEALNIQLGTVILDFLDTRGKQLRPKTLYDYNSIVGTCFKDWLNRPIREISRQDTLQRYKLLADERGGPLANKAMRVLSSIFNFAKGNYEINGQRLIDHNPVTILTETRVRVKERPRERYIHSEDLERFIKAIIKVDETVRDYLLLLLFTGLRSNEAMRLRWKDVDMRRKVFTIPAENAKNHQEHAVPMSNFLFGLFWYRKKKYGNQEYVFPGNGKTGHLIEPRKQIAKVIKETGIQFTPHDLRRTFATILQELDTNEFAIKRLMNHKKQGVTERYIQTRAERFQRHLEEVATYIEAQIDWSKDTPAEDPSLTDGLQWLLYWGQMEETADRGGIPIEYCE